MSKSSDTILVSYGLKNEPKGLKNIKCEGSGKFRFRAMVMTTGGHSAVVSVTYNFSEQFQKVANLIRFLLGSFFVYEVLSHVCKLVFICVIVKCFLTFFINSVVLCPGLIPESNAKLLFTPTFQMITLQSLPRAF